MGAYMGVSFLMTFAGVLAFLAARSEGTEVGMFLAGTAAFLVALAMLLVMEDARHGKGGE